MKAKEPRVVVLAVAEVTEMIESLNAAKSIRNLSGRQRQQLQDACDELLAAMIRAQNGGVRLPMPTVVRVLRCAVMTQTWLSDMLTDLSDTNE